MATLPVSDFLTYANLQLAAEAFLIDANGEPLLNERYVEALRIGNKHSSKFTTVEADKFAAEWQVLDQCANTETGFSGTLFRDRETGELVLSMRSTEFIDDAVRDNRATNAYEIRNTGWAWGQIADMEAWYSRLRGPNGPLAQQQFSVTGYSLGGHLATAFNLLRREECETGQAENNPVRQVVTFNGAGVGIVKEGGLTAALDYFETLRASTDAIVATFGNSELASNYRTVNENLKNRTWSVAQAKSALDGLHFPPTLYTESQIAELNKKKLEIWRAVDEIGTLIKERARLTTLTKGGNGTDANTNPLEIPGNLIDAEQLNYRMAVKLAAQRTESATLLGGLVRGFTNKEYLYPALENQYDVVGATSPSAVANSQWHYGHHVPIFIEDQPVFRGGVLSGVIGDSLKYEDIKLLVDQYALRDFGDSGGVLSGVIGDSLKYEDIKLLVDQYALRDFGDTHSLVLLVDSLNVQNTFLQLLPADQQGTDATRQLLNTIFRQASYLKGQDGDWLIGTGQGKAEGDVLENLVSSLGILFLGPEAYDALKGNPNGGTWAMLDDAGEYTGRNSLYKALKTIVGEPPTAYDKLKGKLTLSSSSVALKDVARDDFTAFAAIYSLSPFQIKAGPSGNSDELEKLLGAAWGKTYKDWTDDRSLTPAERAAGKAKISDSWLSDRSSFLGYWLTAAEVNNNRLTGVTSSGLPSTMQLVFKDLSSGQNVAVLSDFVNSGEAAPGRDSQYVAFGGKGVDVMDGDKFDDHFYGGLGTDYLSGKGGNDYLEGGYGLDLYTYNAKKAALFGAGTNDGDDTLCDIDGVGVLRYTYVDESGQVQSTVVADASSQLSETQWRSADGKFRYTKDGGDLVITVNGDAGGRMTLKNFKNGDYGIRLWKERADPSINGAPILGDRKYLDIDPSADGMQTETDELGNIKVTDEIDADRADVLYGDQPADAQVANPNLAGEKIDAGGGNDRIFADPPRGTADIGLGNSDWVIGGGGRDWIEAGGGNDLVEAGADGVWSGSFNGQQVSDTGGDIVDGGAGNDEVYGATKIALSVAVANGNSETGSGIKGDWLSGGAGDDVVIAGNNNDVLAGGGGNDILIAGAGDDDILGDHEWIPARFNWTVTDQAGNRLFDPAVGSEVFSGDGSDVIYAGQGNDYVWAGIGNDLVFGEAGDDRLYGNAGHDTLLGGDGKDIILGGADGDYLDGGTGDDHLMGEKGDDILAGGAGKDVLKGGAGKDIYLFNKGDGIEVIDDAPEDPLGLDGSVVILGEGLSKENVKFRLGSLLVDFGASDPDEPESSHDAIHFLGFESVNPETTRVIGELRFFDGQVMTYDEILAQGFEIDGTDGNDNGHDAVHPQLLGTGVADRIHGHGGDDVLAGLGGADSLFGDAGNDELQGGRGDDGLNGGDGDDRLFGQDGNDVLDGGTGSDHLDGGAGDDTYKDVDATDTVIDTEGKNTIHFAAGIAVDDIDLTTVDINGTTTLALSIGGRQVMTAEHTQAASFVAYQFADGIQLSHEAMLGERLFQSQIVSGTAENEIIRGYAGDDTLNGADGNDDLHGYRGDDTLAGDSGSDTLIGGKGNDFLVGGDGSDTYVYARGDGRDVILDQGGMAGENVIRFVGDIGRVDVTITRLANGDLFLQIGSGDDEITVRDWYNNPENRVAQIEFADGTVVTGTDLDGLTVAPIEGSSNADTLTGTAYSDTILGHDGDDTLDGGAGNDHIEGGAGVDAYIFKYGMGQDNVLDASVEGNIVKLAAGIRFADVDAERNGDDAVLRITGTGEGMVIQDYYANPQTWSVTNDAGDQQGVEELVAATQAARQDTVNSLWRDYLASARNAVVSEYLTQGYQARADGTFYQSWTDGYWAKNLYADLSEFSSTVKATMHWFPEYYGGGSFTSTDKFRNRDWYTATPLLGDSVAALDSVVTNSDDAIIYGLSNSTYSSTFQTVVAEARWKPFTWTATSQSSSENTGPVYEGGPDGPVVVGTNTVETTNFYGSGYARGEVVGVLSAGSVPLSSGYYPQYINATFTSASFKTTFEEIRAGASDNVIYGNGNTLVDAGDGNDTVSGAGFAFGGAGNDILEFGNIILGGAGDDTLRFGKVLIGGAGDDVMDGGAGATRYLIDPNEFGYDTITDSGDNEASYKEWYYHSLGIEDIELHETLGGKWIPGVAEAGVFDSYDDAVAFAQENVDAFDRQSWIDSLLFVPPLPPLSKPAANEYAALEPLYESGLIEQDAIEFDAGLAPDDVTVHWVSETAVRLSWGDGNGITVQMPTASSPIGTGIELFKFHDGTVWNLAELERRAVTPAGTDNDDELIDGALGHVIHGLGGNDSIYGGGGSDTLNGGAGDDYLKGGAGNDVYLFGRGEGTDTIDQSNAMSPDIDVIRFASDIQSSDVTMTREGDALRLTIADTGESIVQNDWYAAGVKRVARVEFADGTVWNLNRETLVGTDSDDEIFGAELDSEINGLGGDDSLFGGAGNDVLDGGAGADTLSGGNDNDVYFFGRGGGTDVIDQTGAGLSDIDLIRFEADVLPSDVIAFREGDALHLTIRGTDDIIVQSDWFAAGAKRVSGVQFANGMTWSTPELLLAGERITGSAGNDTLTGTDNNDVFFGLNGDDAIAGAGGDDLLDGGSGGDVLEGGDGNDTLIAGADGVYDYLYGGAGNDVYLFGRHAGGGYIDDEDGDADSVRFDATVSAADVKVSRDISDLYLSADGMVDSIDLAGWINRQTIEEVQFADGTVWTQADLLAKISTTSTEGDDFLSGTAADEILPGFGGDDALYGLEGVDLLLGGAGNDFLADWEGVNALDGGDGHDYLTVETGANFLAGGRGDDDIDNWGANGVVSFNAGDGADYMYVNGDFTLSLGAGIAITGLSFTVEGSDLILGIGEDDSVRFVDFLFTYAAEERPAITLQVIGTDVRTYDFNAVLALFDEHVAQGGSSSAWPLFAALESNLIDSSVDYVIGGEVAYRYAHNGTLDPLDADVIRSTLVDPGFGVVAQLVETDGEQPPINAEPILGTPIENQSVSEDSPFVFQVPDSTFTDPDAGDELSVQATLNDGSDLPAWLAFDPDTMTFSGTPDNSAVGSLVVKVKATDQAGATVDASFELTVDNVNDVPVVAQEIPSALATEDELFSFTVPTGIFQDADTEDDLAYSATLSNGEALPGWLTFDAETAAFSGIPGNDDVGEILVSVTVTDQSGAAASSNLSITVANVNDAPIISHAIGDQAARDEVLFSYTVSADAFQDRDVGDYLTYSATLATGYPLPAWVTFDPETRTLSGTPGGEVGRLSIRIVATDTAGLSTADTFDLIVAPAADKTLTGTSGADVLVGASGNDFLEGRDGADSLFGNQGNDTITDSNGSDTIDGGAGDDVITDQGNGTNTLRGGDGNDTITFSLVANNTLEGGAGDDVLKVGSLAFGSRDYANTIAGGTSNDRMESGGSADTYLFNRGDGRDVIRDYDYDQGDKLDRVVFGAGITASDVAVSRLGNHLVLKVNDPGNPAATDQITIENWSVNRLYRLEQVVFADGTTWSTAQLSNLAVTGTDGSDSISGWGDASVIDGRGGNDTIQSWNSDDRVYGGDGNDTITDTGGSDTLDGGAGDDVIDDIDSNGTNVLRGGDGNDTINFGNGRNTIEGGSGNDLIRQSNIYPSNNANTIAGGQGNDRMESGGSPDTYLFARGDGQDTIRDWNFLGMGAPDRLIFGAGIAASDVAVSRSGNNLVLTINDPANPAATDQITIEDWNITSGLYRLEQVAFADGTTWTMAQLSSMAMIGTDASDNISVWSGGGYADGKGGNDSINGSSSSDTIDGGAGDDVITDTGNGTNALRGGDGNDTITFSHLANNTLEGGAGDDVLKVGSVAFGSRDYANTIAGGTGNDRMESGGNADTYLFNRGDGRDVIRDYDYDQGDKLDRVVFGAGITASDVAVSRLGNHLVLKVNDPGNPAATDQITIENWSVNRLYRLEQVVFADGTTWSTAQLSNLAVTGTDGSDSISGWGDASVIDGRGGNDTIQSWNSNDSVYGGGGSDTITDTGGSDTLDGGAGDDVIDDIDSNGTNVLRGGDGNDTINFGNGWNAINGGSGNDLIRQSNFYPSNNANTIAGGQGNDRMESGGSPDTYLFARGDGQDTIRDWNFQGMGAPDRLIFGAGIAASDVAVSRSGNHLVLTINDPANPAAADQITIEDWNTSSGLYRLEQVEFADSTMWTMAQVDAMAVTLKGTDGADTLDGWSVNDIIYGLDGNDTITDLDGNDLLNGGLGNDTLDGGARNDLFIGASGDDLIVTGAGADIVAFNRGDGQDVIAASTGKDNTLSLGHGIHYVDLLFQKNNNDLTLQTGASEQLVFKDWYSSVNNRSVATLQMVIEGTADYDAASANQLNNKKVQQFNFDGLVAKFDSARSADPSLASWSLSSFLLEFHLNGSSDTAALGGDLAYQYAENGDLSGISASPAQAILASTQFGTANQNLQSSNALQDLTPRLM